MIGEYYPILMRLFAHWLGNYMIALCVLFRQQPAESFIQLSDKKMELQLTSFPAASNTSKFRWGRWALILLLVMATLFALYIAAVLNWSYSRGERAGYVQKFSQKGWACKTWEGELAMVSMPGTLTEKFLFTVRDDNVAAEINKSMGKRVSLVYEEHLGIPTSCLGDTAYFVTDIRLVE